MMIKYKQFNKDGEPLTRSSMKSSEWTDKELYEDLPRQLKALRDSQKPFSSNSRKVVGVTWSEQHAQWVVRFTMNGRQNYIGKFDTHETAVYEKVKAMKEIESAG
jgi:hypothetical protein